MDLWVRTQDKTNLVRIENGLTFYNYYSRVDDKKSCVIKQIEPCQTKPSILGSYKNEKRAMQILDEIQKLMQSKIENIYAVKEEEFEFGETIKYFKEFINPNCIVYQMPKE